MAIVSAGEPVFSKYPADLQIRVKTGKEYQWVPFTSATFDVTKEMTAEHYSGTGLPANITEGNTDYKGTFELGWLYEGLPTEWIEQGITEIDAQYWEYLLYKYLINPANQGRSRPFDLEFHEREYTGVMLESGSEQVVGGEIWALFSGCKLQHHTFNSAQGSLAKRTYDWMGKRAKWGSHAEI
jgi:hypothetical protein